MRDIAVFEKKSGILRLILFLEENGETMLSSIWPNAGIPVHQGYGSLSSLKDLGLVAVRVDNSAYPPKNMVSLTEKGKIIAEKLKEIEIVLREENL